MGRVHPPGFWGRLRGPLVPLFDGCDRWRVEGPGHGVGAGGVALWVSVGGLSHQADGDGGLAGTWGGKALGVRVASAEGEVEVVPSRDFFAEFLFDI